MGRLGDPAIIALPERAPLARRFKEVRNATERLTATLSAEDQTVQSMPDASPAKWHLAHTTWFFETFILRPLAAGYADFDATFGYLFNSYYDAVGCRHPRPERGLLMRPGLGVVTAYRRHVTQATLRFIEEAAAAVWPHAAPLIELGLNHEQQHQELILTDILDLFARHPAHPAVFDLPATEPRPARPLGWLEYEGGLRDIGHEGGAFAFDNEGPRHRVHLRPYRFADRLVTNGEYRRFIADGGYRRPEYWLSDGWAVVRSRGWSAPARWLDEGRAATLCGVQPLDDAAPVAHVCHYEADAYARWAGKRLPTEAEWEVAAASHRPQGNLLESGWFRALPAGPPVAGEPAQIYGDLWEWTASPYAPYPGFRPAGGAVGEYNGKFMINQMVLRGGSFATPRDHIRPTYRNFFYPDARWQFTGIRLAEDA